MEAMKVETDIIVSIRASTIGRAVTLVKMYVENFKTDVVVFIDNIILCPSVGGNISRWKQKENV